MNYADVANKLWPKQASGPMQWVQSERGGMKQVPIPQYITNTLNDRGGSTSTTVKNAAYYKAVAPSLSTKGVNSQWSADGITDLAAFMKSFTALSNSLYESGVNTGESGETHGIGTNQAIYKQTATNQNLADYIAAQNWGIEKGIFPKDGGLSWGFRDAFLNPAVLAAAGAYAGAGAGAGADSAAASDAGMLASPGGGTTGGAYAGGTSAGVSAGGGGNTAFGGGNMSANAAASGGAPSGLTAANTINLVKDYGGLALTLSGLLGSGGDDAFPDAPTSPDAPPKSQAALQPDEIERRRRAATGSTDTTLLTGASGIDPFSLNLGRSKLLGQ